MSTPRQGGALGDELANLGIIALIAAGADVPQVANATITAAEKAFSFVMNPDCPLANF